MDILTVVLYLLILQGILGGFDTLYHHELRCALPQQKSAVRELKIHAIRAMLYGVVFLGLAWFHFGGWMLVVFWAIISTEIILTLIDFVEEDRSRLLPPSERITHTILAINGGALFGLLAYYSINWWTLPTRLHLVSYGWKSWALSLLGFGVFVSGIRDAFAHYALAKAVKSVPNFDFIGEHTNQYSTFFITGGTGFIGQNIVHALLAQGHQVTLWARNPLKASYMFHGRVECVTSLEQLNPNRSFDVIINLAGERILGLPWSAKQKKRLLDSRVGLTQKLSAWIAQSVNKPKLFISGSAIGYYGIQDPEDTTKLNEKSPHQSIFMSELCQQWEASARTMETMGVTVIRLRFGMVLGLQGALPPMLLPIRLGVGGAMGSGKQIMSWVHIDDVVGVVAWLCRREHSALESGVYNMVAPEFNTQKDFIKTAAAILKRPAFLATPAWVIRMLLGEQSMILLEGQRVIPEHLLAEGYAFQYPTLPAALSQIIHANAT